jgi:hypothetical protein
MAAGIEVSKAANVPVMDLLAAGTAISLAAASSLPSSTAIWARAVAALVPAFFPLVILLGKPLNKSYKSFNL